MEEQLTALRRNKSNKNSRSWRNLGGGGLF
jgi:hypothetical protein